MKKIKNTLEIAKKIHKLELEILKTFSHIDLVSDDPEKERKKIKLTFIERMKPKKREMKKLLKLLEFWGDNEFDLHVDALFHDVWKKSAEGSGFENIYSALVALCTKHLEENNTMDLIKMCFCMGVLLKYEP